VLRELDLKNVLRCALAACVLLLGAAAHAAPTDCISPSDPTAKAICQPPELTPVTYGACIANSLSTVENATGYCFQQYGLNTNPAYSEGPVVGAMNCVYKRVTGSTTDVVQSFAWKAEGQSVSSFLCWNQAVKWKYGVEMVGVAEQSPPGWYTLFGRRSRTAYCRPGEYAVNNSSGEIEYCTLPVVNGGACTAGNPTKPDLGTKLERSTDYAGAGAHALSFERLYRSTWSPQLPQNRVGGFWAHNYSASARILDGSTYGSRYAFVTRADGEHHVYTNATGNWIAATPSRNVLIELRDTAGALVGVQLQVWQDNSTETYDASGRLLNIKARNGWLTTLTYSDATTPALIAPRAGLLISVKNHFGRELRFTYDTQGRMVELLPPGAVSGTGAGSSTSPIRYSYDEAASLGPGVPAQGQLSSVTWQDGSVRRYHHERTDNWYIANGPQLLTGITDEAGVRYATWAYDGIQPYDWKPRGARVVRSEHAGGTDRLEFNYSENQAGQPVTTITDYSSGSAQRTTHTYADIGNTRMPVSVSAPCKQCSGTAQSTAYNETADKVKEIAHDGSVTFFTYDARGRETEGASFPSSFNTATTRPALASATKVISTKWHATFNLPTQVAEPNKTTANTYNSKGMLTGTSWTATSDVTGAAKFSAGKTGSTYATGWGYSASSLATTIVTKETAAGATVAVETGRWTATYAANGNLTRNVDVKGGNRTATMTQYDAHGRMLSGTTDLGTAMTLTYTTRGAIARQGRNGRMLDFTYNAVGNLATVRTPDGQTIDYVHDANQMLVDVKLNGVSITPQMLADSSYPDTPLKAQVALAKQWLALGIESLMSQAHAQTVVIPGSRGSPSPVFDPRTDMLMSPMSDSEKQLRALQEAFARLCQCDPGKGYSNPKFTSKTFAHVFWGGHTSPMFADQSYFAYGTRAGQALVDQVVALSATQPGSLTTNGSRDRYRVFMGGPDVGMVRDPANPNGPLIPGKYVFMVVEKNNCAGRWKYNEVVTIYPEM
jgi:YD repeat-containing protein